MEIPRGATCELSSGVKAGRQGQRQHPSNTARAATRPATRASNPPSFTQPCSRGRCSQVNDEPVTTYKAGQSLSELPGDRHAVSANTSKTKPAKLLAVFVVDTNETELTIPFAN